MPENDPVEPIIVDEEPTKVVVATPETTVVESPAATAVVVKRKKVYGGMWGTPEIIAVAAGAAMLFIVVLAYFFWVLPANRELARNKSEADRLEAELISAKSKYGEITTTEGQVSKLLTSVDNFQMSSLPVAANGQGALYQRLNGLFMSYGLVNTSGPDYAPLEIAGMNEDARSTDQERGRAKFRSLFPGVYVTVTLEGTYQNLRRFIRELETGRDFVVVSAVELAPSDNEKPAGPVPVNAKPALQPNQAAPGMVQPKGKMHGEYVSLHIELAAYFRRPDFAPMAPPLPAER